MDPTIAASRARTIVASVTTKPATDVDDGVTLEMLGLAEEERLDALVDALEDGFDTVIGSDEAEAWSTVGDVAKWAVAHVEEAGSDKDDDDEFDARELGVADKFAWRERISPMQRTLLKISPFIGFAIFFVGVQFVVRAGSDPATSSGQQALGGALSALGMFVAAEMMWGVAALFNFIERRQPALLRIGYPTLFWLLLIPSYLFSLLGVGLIFLFLGV